MARGRIAVCRGCTQACATAMLVLCPLPAFTVGRRDALLADAALAAAAVPGEVQVEMVAVIEVVGRAEHGREDAARPAMHVAQEVALSQPAPPAALDIDRAPIG